MGYWRGLSGRSCDQGSLIIAARAAADAAPPATARLRELAAELLAAAQRLGAWADRVRHLGLLRNIVLDTYYPEVGRYGTGAAMQAAEAVRELSRG